MQFGRRESVDGKPFLTLPSLNGPDAALEMRGNFLP
jgi:hypothetical protein